MDFLSVLLKMIQLFAVIIIGAIANKCGIFNKDTRVKVTKIVLNITMPAMMLASICGDTKLPGRKEILVLLFVAVSLYVVQLVCALIVPVILRSKPDEIGIYRFMVMFGNVGFIGFPVTQAIFGDASVFYTTVFNLPFNLFLFTCGVYFLLASSADKDAQNPQKLSLATFLTPAFLSSIIVIVFALGKIPVPAMIGDTCTMVGNATTPAALMIIGSTLADIPVKALVGSVRLYLMSLFRLIIIPVIVFFGYKLFVTDTLLLGECVIMAAMPVASNGTMLCLQYDCDEKIMAQGTFITTVLSIVTIPLFAMFLA